MALWLPVYLGIGLLTAAATEFGDLVESCIKRKVDIKDMASSCRATAESSTE